MTNEQINAAIATALGWELVHFEGGDLGDVWDSEPDDVWKNPSGHFVRWGPPNYCESRDVMAIAEATLEGLEALAERRAYVSALMTLVGVSPDMDGKWSYIQDFALLNAGPMERAKAFLTMKGVL